MGHWFQNDFFLHPHLSLVKKKIPWKCLTVAQTYQVVFWVQLLLAQVQKIFPSLSWTYLQTNKRDKKEPSFGNIGSLGITKFIIWSVLLYKLALWRRTPLWISFTETFCNKNANGVIYMFVTFGQFSGNFEKCWGEWHTFNIGMSFLTAEIESTQHQGLGIDHLRVVHTVCWGGEE